MPILGKKNYDILKFIAQILLPALGTLYFALANTWGLPSADEVVATVVAVDTFLGVLLQLSSTAYNNSTAKFDGVLSVGQSPEGPQAVGLALKKDLEDLGDRKTITIQVQHED